MFFAMVGAHGPVVTMLAIFVACVVCSLWHFLRGVLKSNRIWRQLEIGVESIAESFSREELIANDIDEGEWKKWLFVTMAVIIHVGLIVSFKRDKLMSTQSAINMYTRKMLKSIEGKSSAKMFFVETMKFMVSNCKDASIQEYSERFNLLAQRFFIKASCELLDRALQQLIGTSISIVNRSGFLCSGSESNAMNPDMGY